MFSIESGIRIATTPAAVVRAFTTVDGLRGWWSRDVTHAPARRELALRFDKPTGPMAFTLRVEHAGDDGVELACVAESHNPDWLGTRLTVRLTPDGDGTRVALVHAGYPARNEVYEMCSKGWPYFLESLKAYLEAGAGTPHVGATRAVVDAVDVAAPPARVLAALTTAEGVRGWWTQDCEIGPREHTYAFSAGGPRASATFRVDRADEGGVTLTCVREVNGMAWSGTELAFALEADGAGTHVALAHAGFPRLGGPYEQCVGGWRHFLASLKAYVETGAGTPHVPGASVSKAVAASQAQA
ncbi:MAG TPA: SRPBCC domain-containing protein [Kofleriaceae bacterium]|nr:SRPBCC domain-containing protein [Kofleriaceae bacterium]